MADQTDQSQAAPQSLNRRRRGRRRVDWEPSVWKPALDGKDKQIALSERACVAILASALQQDPRAAAAIMLAFLDADARFGSGERVGTDAGDDLPRAVRKHLKSIRDGVAKSPKPTFWLEIPIAPQNPTSPDGETVEVGTADLSIALDLQPMGAVQVLVEAKIQNKRLDRVLQGVGDLDSIAEPFEGLLQPAAYAAAWSTRPPHVWEPQLRLVSTLGAMRAAGEDWRAEYEGWLDRHRDIAVSKDRVATCDNLSWNTVLGLVDQYGEPRATELTAALKQLLNTENP
jgi:hypothetical protein